ncbi:MAG: hypothetical protein ABSD41_03255 [Candidatus Bathyarchaeia archaeon]
MSAIGIEMPQDFPIKPYENVLKRLVDENDRHPTSFWSEFASAWNAIAYRFRSCAEHDGAFTESIGRAGNSPPSPERYVQERELFCFFVTGMSTIESFCYSLFAIGSMLDAQTFPLETAEGKRDVTPKMTIDKFGTAFPCEIITSILKRLNDSQEYWDWRTMRNILSHRSTPSRQFFRGGGHDGNAVWGGILIDENTTVSRRRWLANNLSDLLEATDTFTVGKFF